jgi:hypothetical protein
MFLTREDDPNMFWKANFIIYGGVGWKELRKVEKKRVKIIGKILKIEVSWRKEIKKYGKSGLLSCF